MIVLAVESTRDKPGSPSPSAETMISMALAQCFGISALQAEQPLPVELPVMLAMDMM